MEVKEYGHDNQRSGFENEKSTDNYIRLWGVSEKIH